MRMLVCGGRDFVDFHNLCAILDRLHKLYGVTLLIDGGNGKMILPNGKKIYRTSIMLEVIESGEPFRFEGADVMGHIWAKLRGIPTKQYFPDWDTFGKSAGFRRNHRMLIEGQPQIVVGFPGGRGTANMIDISRRASVQAGGIMLLDLTNPANYHDSVAKVIS